MLTMGILLVILIVTFVFILGSGLLFLQMFSRTQTSSQATPIEVSNRSEKSNSKAAFRWSYAVAQIPAGWLVDHFAVRWTYLLAVGVWSLAGGAAAWASVSWGALRGSWSPPRAWEAEPSSCSSGSSCWPGRDSHDQVP